MKIWRFVACCSACFICMSMLPVLCQIVPGIQSIFHYCTTSPIDLPAVKLLMKRERICHNKPDLLLCKRGIFSNQMDFWLHTDSVFPGTALGLGSDNRLLKKLGSVEHGHSHTPDLLKDTNCWTLKPSHDTWDSWRLRLLWPMGNRLGIWICRPSKNFLII
jgi:hypothetical protein